MNLPPCGYLSTSSVATMRDHEHGMLVGAYSRCPAFDHLNKDVLPELMRELGIRGRANVAAVVMRLEDRYEVHMKVITSRGIVVFTEGFSEFPSDHLKAKLLMVCG